MTRFIATFLIVFGFALFGCKEPDSPKHYNYLGQASFRRSYAGYKDWTASEIDSIEKSRPAFMFPTRSSENQVLDILTHLGIANESELFVDKINSYLKDTIFIADKTTYIDTVYIKYDTKRTRAVIQIKNGQTMDSIPIKDEAFSHTFSLVKLKTNSSPMIVFINQYYIMNGDNYEVSLYEKNKPLPIE